MKKIWMTSLLTAEDTVKKVMTQLRSYGLEADGRFWEDNLAQMAWIHARDEIVDPKVALWLILASHERLAVPSVRYGLSLLAVTVQARRGHGFPIVILLDKPETTAPENLATPLRGADRLSLTDQGFCAKLVAKAHSPVKEVRAEYRLDVCGNAQIGQWVEVGPVEKAWAGCMFGVEGAKIVFHAVGPKGSLPTRSTLRHPVKDMAVTLGDKNYVAWAVQNELSPEDSYFLKMEDFPDSVVFGPYAREEEAEVHVIQLK
jgi:hypothetical protein